ncbi:MAG: hypothetical protein RJA99_1210 [Pseudomonadota bacterium]|jgi:hypothetical protein
MTVRRPQQAVVLVALVLAAAPLAAVERVDSTLPNASTPPVRGERVLQTRPQREASEARLANELARDAELRRLAAAPLDPWAAGGFAPGWVLPGVPCPVPGCPPRPLPAPYKPTVRPDPTSR